MVKTCVCLTVKAGHLELVSDLTAEAFLAAFRRFISRRGCPSMMWSDQGSNFVGTNSDLKDLSENKINLGAISELCSSQKIKWRFIPERAPHFGGIWESNVKSVKSHLKRIISPVNSHAGIFASTWCVISGNDGQGNICVSSTNTTSGDFPQEMLL